MICKTIARGVLALLICLNSVQAAITLRSALTHENSAVPGQSYQGSIEIGNPMEQAQDVHIIKYDYRSSASGESYYDLPLGKDRSNADWVDLSPEYVTIPAKSTTTISYTVQVPTLDSLNGSYWSVLMIEPADKLDPFRSEKILLIKSKFRYAVKLITNIYEGRREVTFLDSKIVSREPDKVLQVDLHNSGTAVVKPTMALQLFDEQGRQAGKFECPYQTLVPASARRFEIVLSSELCGKYKALLVADCGEDALFGITFDLELSSSKNPDQDAVGSVSGENANEKK